MNLVSGSRRILEAFASILLLCILNTVQCRTIRAKVTTSTVKSVDTTPTSEWVILGALTIPALFIILFVMWTKYSERY